MPSKKVLTPVEAGGVYHIFNRGVNYQNVFFSDEDYQFFLEKFKFYLSAVCETYAYALLPNHYHFLIKVSEDAEHLEFSMKFKNFILSYTNSICKRDKISGNLFLSRFKRLEVTNEFYLTQLIYYIHHNPESHKVISDYRDYQFSSFRAFLSNKQTLIVKEDVMEHFGNRENFLYYHNLKHEEDILKEYAME